MQVIVNGRHIDVTDALRNYAESKVKRLKNTFRILLRL